MKMIYRRFKQEGVTIAHNDYARNLHEVRDIIRDGGLYLSAAEQQWLVGQLGLSEENLDSLHADDEDFAEDFVQGVWERYEEHGKLDVGATWWLDGFIDASETWRKELKNPGSVLELLGESAAQELPAVTESLAPAPGG